MEKPLCMTASRFFGVIFFLLLITCTSAVVRPYVAAPNALYYNLSDLTEHPYGNIFSPLIKALSQHGGSRWNPDLRKRIKPEHKYIKYLTEVYRRSSRVQRSVQGNGVYNTVRLIKPQDECLAQKYEGFMQDLSYRLDQVRKKEQLLKSTLLYSFGPGHSSLVGSVCHLHIKELEPSTHCHFCQTRNTLHSVNFTGDGGVNWVEINVTAFLLPLLKFQVNNLHLLINVTCEEGSNGNSQNHMFESALRSPPLLLYLSDTTKLIHQRLGTNKAEQKTSAVENKLHKEIFKTRQRILHRQRWKRSSSKNKRDKSLKTQLPELLPSSEFPTSDCALYDFRVRFSQLKLDHWIVFPPKYNPRYCRGICPRTVGFFYGSPVHTMVQNIIYEKLDSSVPRPSCVPSHYSPLSVMIFEEDGSYVYKEFEDMVATRCTCR
ncbi:growth/differentiation factor 9 [Boleophthalmus pectinirostris]|uniref:Growth differentiation factor 9 n=1 Tax=Boleophthalmus pectinirostris TaxID=150288 RepID=S5DZ36_BOLPE|nr:growth/differentiation factor 9 [Boleophthalmus pectinirostris]AGQ20429.1 growth differentiation factor 9 [Boleophthalmus pectinirostris]